MLFLPNPLSASVSAVFRPVHKRHLKEAFEQGRPAREIHAGLRTLPFEARSGVKPRCRAVFYDAPRTLGSDANGGAERPSCALLGFAWQIHEMRGALDGRFYRFPQ